VLNTAIVHQLLKPGGSETCYSMSGEFKETPGYQHPGSLGWLKCEQIKDATWLRQRNSYETAFEEGWLSTARDNPASRLAWLCKIAAARLADDKAVGDSDDDALGIFDQDGKTARVLSTGSIEKRESVL